MNWKGGGDSKTWGVPFFPPGVGGRGSVSQCPTSLLPTTAITPERVPSFIPPMFTISAHMGVSTASRGHVSPPDGNTPRLGNAPTSAD